MSYIKAAVVTAILGATSVYGSEFGLSTSGRDISLNFILPTGSETTYKPYLRGFYDFESYQNGDEITVCRDGETSGSTGSGTCSWHGGVSHTEEADFSRFGAAFGVSFDVSERVKLNAGVVWAMYSPDISVGNNDDLGYSDFGVDLGVSYQIVDASPFMLSLNHETEQGRTSIGYWYPW